MRAFLITALASLITTATVAACSGPATKSSGADQAASETSGIPTSLPDGICLKSGFCWSHPLPQGTDLTTVVGTDPNHVWAVGGGELFAWDGKRWDVADHPLDSVYSASIGKDGRLWLGGYQSVAVLANGTWTRLDAPLGWHNVTAVEDTVCALDVRKVACLDSGKWKQTELGPSADNAPTLLVNAYAIRAIDKANVWVTGAYGFGGYSAHIDMTGENLAVTEYSTAGGDAASNWRLDGLWTGAETDIWAGGVGGLRHFDGTSWTRTTDPDVGSMQVNSVEGRENNYLFAVGNGGTIARYYGGQWHGWPSTAKLDLLASWQSPTPTTEGDTTYMDSWVVGATAAMFRIRSTDQDPYSYKVTEQEDPIRNGWGSSEHDAWAVAGNTTLLHFSNGSWNRQPLPSAENIVQVHGTAADDVWVLTSQNALHWNGLAWQPVALSWDGAPVAMQSIFAIAKDDVWFGTAKGALHFDGASFAQSSTSAYDHLWASGPNDVWGTAGTDLEHFDGKAWSKAFASPEVGGYEPGDFTAVTGTAPDDIWAAGIGLFHFDGTSWTTVSESADATSLFARNRDDVWVASNVAVTHYEGATITNTLQIPIFVPYEQNSPPALFATDDTLWTVAGRGAVLKSVLPAQLRTP